MITNQVCNFVNEYSITITEESVHNISINYISLQKQGKEGMRGKRNGRSKEMERGRKIAYSWRQVEELLHLVTSGGGGGCKLFKRNSGKWGQRYQEEKAGKQNRGRREAEELILRKEEEGRRGREESMGGREREGGGRRKERKEGGREGRRKERKPATRTWSTELGRQVTTPTSSQLK